MSTSNEVVKHHYIFAYEDDVINVEEQEDDWSTSIR